jgi:hypothetical protein
MVQIAATGWYYLTLTASGGGGGAKNYYFKDDAQILTESGWQPITVAGIESALHEAVNTGYKQTITLRVYDQGDAYAAIKSYITTPAVGQTAVADSNTAAITISKVTGSGSGPASFAFTALPRTVTENLTNKEGHNANVVFEAYRAVPALT